MNLFQRIICKICGEYFDYPNKSVRGEIGRTYKQIMTEVSDISGRSLSHIISTVFADDEIMQQFVTSSDYKEAKIELDERRKNEGACGTCFNLLEQVRN